LLLRHLSSEAQLLQNALEAENRNDESVHHVRSRRLAHLREPVAKGNHNAALDFSLALQSNHRSSLDHEDCHADRPHVGEGTTATHIATPDLRGDSRSAPIVTSHIRLHHDEGAPDTLLRLVVDAKKVTKSALRTPVVGFGLDGAFVLAESPVCCKAKD
jgi:hypothetical protein